MIFLAFALTVTILYIFGVKQHFKLMISLAFAFKVTILYIFGKDFLSICLQSDDFVQI